MLELSSINHREIYRYLGYGSSQPDTATASLVKKVEKKLLRVIRPRHIYRLFRITPVSGGVQLEDGKLFLPGNDIYRHLKGCKRAVLMAATLAADTDRFLKKLQFFDMAEAAIANSAANTAIEQVCDAVAEEIKNRLPLLYQTSRYSPGYGDLPISIQKEFLNILDAPKKIGLTVTTNSIMVPEKSVSAIIGLSEKPFSRKRRSCRECNLHETCMFRLRGSRCDS
ncbi:MAG: methionine synthase [Deltaproteobacteria bacterium]|nr:MAG: methionine synthase [Deltaproteobacteria bacterium]